MPRDVTADDLIVIDPGLRLPPDVRLRPGEPTGKLIDLPNRRAQKMLRAVVRVVADLPRRSTPDVVWTQGASELLVFTNAISIRCTAGVVTIRLAVSCDQIDGPAKIAVPLAVGTREVPAGLVMSTFAEVSGPPVITDIWSEALTAFAWESLLELARRIAAGVGDDAKGRSLVPGSIAAAPRRLLIQPIARQEFGLGGAT